MRIALLLIGTGLPMLSAVVYIVSILRGKSRPHRMTRLLLMIVTMLSFASLFAAHDRAALWLALAAMVEATVIWALSLKRGMGGREPLDLICFGLCAAGLALWLASGESLFGLVMSIVADFVACVPALRKTIRLPHTESFAFYALGVIGSAAILLASEHTFQAMLYPAYLLLIDGVFATAIIWPRRAAAAIPTDG